MNNIIYQTMTLSSPDSLGHLSDAKLSYFIGYSVATQTISAPIKRNKVQTKDAVIKSLERSLKVNAEIWAELSKH